MQDLSGEKLLMVVLPISGKVYGRMLLGIHGTMKPSNPRISLFNKSSYPQHNHHHSYYYVHCLSLLILIEYSTALPTDAVLNILTQRAEQLPALRRLVNGSTWLFNFLPKRQGIKPILREFVDQVTVNYIVNNLLRHELQTK